MQTENLICKAQALLSTIFLSANEHNESEVISGASIQWVIEWLSLDPVKHFGIESLQHLLAVQLSPAKALAYKRTDPCPRWKYIKNYVSGTFNNIDDIQSELLARQVSRILDRAEVVRARVPSENLVPDACEVCRLPFFREPDSVRLRDPYKPIWKSTDVLAKPEIDHIISISSLGTNAEENLQVICRACNLAKSSALELHPKAEIANACLNIVEINRMHVFRMLQWLIRRSGGSCELCSSRLNELTMRPTNKDAAFVRSSLRILCYECLGKQR